MSSSKDLNLSLWECGGITSQADLAGIMMSLRSLGLAAGSGAFTTTDTPRPVEDLTADIANPWVSEQGKQAPCSPATTADTGQHFRHSAGRRDLGHPDLSTDLQSHRTRDLGRRVHDRVGRSARKTWQRSVRPGATSP